jgi:hypothetical protein
VTIDTSSFASFKSCLNAVAQLVTCMSPFEWGWNLLPNVLNCCCKIRLTLNGQPNFLDLPPHNSLGIVG